MPARPQRPAADESFGRSAFRQPAEDAGLSLDKLSAAFAEMLTGGDDPYQPAAEVPDPEGAVVEPAEDVASDDACEITPRTILEAMLFVGGMGGEPLAGAQVARLMRGVRPAEIDALVRQLNADYQARRCPYSIVAEGSGYRLRLGDDYARLRDKFYGKTRQARLSQAAIEVLSLVAYNGPLSAEEINQLRGTPSGTILAQLVRRQLLLVDPASGSGKRRKYATTSRFLELILARQPGRLAEQPGPGPALDGSGRGLGPVVQDAVLLAAEAANAGCGVISLRWHFCAKQFWRMDLRRLASGPRRRFERGLLE